MEKKTTDRGLFICGTDEQARPTLVAAALARLLGARREPPGLLQPVETGRSNLAPGEDAGNLLRWAGASRLPAERLCPVSLQAPLEPALAATREGCPIDVHDLLEQARTTLEENRFSLIVGCGGLMVPLAGGLLMADFAAMLQLPLLIVSRSGPGTLNSLMLTLLAARHQQLEVGGYLLTDYPEEPGTTLAHDLAVLTAAELVGTLKAVRGTPYRQIEQLSEQLGDLATLSLLDPYLPKD